MRMGGGVAYFPGSHKLQDTGVHVCGQASSLVAEGAAAHVLLQTAPKSQQLTILTDSANVMFAMQHCSQRELWRDFSHHSQVLLLQELQTAQAACTADTHWVKITAHSSVELNERADRLATSAWDDHDAPARTFEPQENPNSLHFYQKGRGEEDEPIKVKPAVLCVHLLNRRASKVIATNNLTVQTLTAAHVGRHLRHTVLWQGGAYSVADKHTKRMLQCITNTYPTYALLHLMGKALAPDCPFCTTGTAET